MNINTFLKGKAAQIRLQRAKKKDRLPKGSIRLYRAMKKAGLDIK